MPSDICLKQEYKANGSIIVTFLGAHDGGNIVSDLKGFSGRKKYVLWGLISASLGAMKSGSEALRIDELLRVEFRRFLPIR